MLVLSRKCGERLSIGDSIEVTVVSVKGGRVQLGINAPKTISILRSELLRNSPPAAKSRQPDEISATLSVSS